MKSLLSLFSIIALFLVLGSCSRCKDCTLTTIQDFAITGADTTTVIREYCGSDLKDIEDNASYTRGNISYSWTCE